MALMDKMDRRAASGLPKAVRSALDAGLRILAARDSADVAKRMALIAFAIRILSAGIAFFSQIVLARLMGDFEYGIFVFVWVLVVLLGNLSCIGFHTTVIRFIPQYREQGALDSLRGLLVTSRMFAMLSACAVAAVGVLGITLFGDLIEAYYLVPLYLACCILPLIALGDVLDGTARANSWPINALSPTYIVRPVLILLIMVLASSFGAAHTAKVAMVCSILATALTTLGQYFVVTFRLGRTVPEGPKTISFMTWFVVALPIFLIEGFSFLLTNSDVVIVGIFMTPDKVAVYFAAAKTIALVHFVFFSVKAAAAPRFSALIAADNRTELAQFAGEVARWTFWPSLAVGLGVMLFGKLLLSLFGASFVEGFWLMGVLLLGILAKALIGPGEVLLTMAGQQKLCVVVYVIALFANISMNAVLIPLFGLYGAAIATSAAMMIESVLLYFTVRRKLGLVLFAFAHPVPKHERMRGQ